METWCPGACAPCRPHLDHQFTANWAAPFPPLSCPQALPPCSGATQTQLKYAVEIVIPRATRMLGVLEPLLEQTVFEDVPANLAAIKQRVESMQVGRGACGLGQGGRLTVGWSMFRVRWTAGRAGRSSRVSAPVAQQQPEVSPPSSLSPCPHRPSWTSASSRRRARWRRPPACAASWSDPPWQVHAPSSLRAWCCCPFLACRLVLQFACGLCCSRRRSAPPTLHSHPTPACACLCGRHG